MSRFSDDLAINTARLQEECVRQPMLFQKYAEECAEALAEMDHAKMVYDTTEARVHFDVRLHPETYNVIKPTEAHIQAAVAMQKEVCEAQEAYHKARYNYEIIKGAVEAFRQRKDMIEMVGKLMLSSFSGQVAMPVVNDTDRQRMSEGMHERAVERIQKAAAGAARRTK